MDVLNFSTQVPTLKYNLHVVLPVVVGGLLAAPVAKFSPSYARLPDSPAGESNSPAGRHWVGRA